jgi:hypothetical protein
VTIQPFAELMRAIKVFRNSHFQFADLGAVRLALKQAQLAQ